MSAGACRCLLPDRGRMVRSVLDTKIEFRNIEAYLQGYSSPLELDSVATGKDLEDWGIDGPGAVTAGVRFLSEQAYGWEVCILMWACDFISSVCDRLMKMERPLHIIATT